MCQEMDCLQIHSVQMYQQIKKIKSSNRKMTKQIRNAVQQTKCRTLTRFASECGPGNNFSISSTGRLEGSNSH